MSSSRFRHEGWLYGLAFLIALAFRLIQLGSVPLTDSEARLALQALHIAQGARPLLAPQPGYILPTSIFFAVFGSFNFWARFVPAIVGSTLVFVPFLFRERIKPLAALILAILIAFDPGLVALSRQASGTILAATFALLAWGLWWNRRYVLAGVCAGLALLGGPSLWAGLLGLGLVWIFRRGMEAKRTTNDRPKVGDDSQLSTPSSQFPITGFRISISYTLASFILAGTLFFVTPNGLSAAFASIPAYLKGWITPPNIPVSRLLIALIAYEPLAFLFGILALIRGWRMGSRRIVRLSLWLGIAFFLAIFYPSRQIADLAWMLIPLLTLAALELTRSFEILPEERVEVGATAIAMTLLFSFAWLNLASVALDPNSQIATAIQLFGRNLQLPGTRYMLLYGTLLILAVCIALVALGWSVRTARLGTTWSLTLFLGIYTLGAAWGASGLRMPAGTELWIPDSRPAQADLLLVSADDLSRWSVGHADAQPVTVMGIDSPALEWLLRNYEVKIVSALDTQSTPPLVITPPMQELGLPAGYRGQDFSWRQEPIWNVMQTSDWLTWIVFRKMPKQPETIILWARTDLFPYARQNP